MRANFTRRDAHLVGVALWCLLALQGCDDDVQVLPGDVTIDIPGQSGRSCEFDSERSSDDRWVWRCTTVAPDGKADGAVAPEGSGGTHWTCVQAEGSGGTHWLCAGETSFSTEVRWDCIELPNLEMEPTAFDALWECSPSMLPPHEQACGVSNTPLLGEWTPDWGFPQVCEPCPGTTDDYSGCNDIFYGRIDAIHGNLADLSFKKADGTAMSVDANFWIADVVGETLLCGSVPLGDLTARTTGVWREGELELHVTDVPIWPSDQAFRGASEGDAWRLAIITGGREGPTQRIWKQHDPFVFEKVCVP